MAFKRILILHSSPDLYGAGRVAFESIKALKEEGHFVILALSSEGPLKEIVESVGCEVRIIPLATIRRKYLNFTGLINRIVNLKKSLSALKKLKDEFAIDTIYSNTAGIITGTVFSGKHKLNHIWHVHEIIPGPKLLLRFYAYLMTRNGDCLITVSDATKAHWEKINSRLSMNRLYNGFEFDAFSGENNFRSELGVSKNTVLVGMVARVHFWKGQEYFIEIAHHLNQKNKSVKFVMVGDAFPGYEYLYDKIDKSKSKYGLNEVIFDLGYRTDVDKILDAIDIFVLPSILPDPLPTTVLEAMTAGKPVVATSHGGASEMVIEGKTGFLIPWDNARKAADKIEPLIANQELRFDMGMAGQIRVKKRFSKELYKENLLEILNSI